MHFQLLPLLLLPSTLAFTFSTTDNDEALKVPGENPLYYCEDPIAANHILQITNVDLDPNPPERGQTLHIVASGNFTKEVVQDAYVRVAVKFGAFTLLKRTEDLCEQMEQVEKKCPLEPGQTSITKDVELPSVIPPGKFVVTADVFNADDEVITCLTAEAQFKAGAAADKKKIEDKESIDL